GVLSAEAGRCRGASSSAPAPVVAAAGASALSGGLGARLVQVGADERGEPHDLLGGEAVAAGAGVGPSGGDRVGAGPDRARGSVHVVARHLLHFSSSSSFLRRASSARRMASLAASALRRASSSRSALRPSSLRHAGGFT